MPDVEMSCVQCRENFFFTEKEQGIFYQRNMTPPQRCTKCRAKRSATGANAPTRFEFVCDHCGKHDTVPFQPKVGRSILCKECFQANKSRVRSA